MENKMIIGFIGLGNVGSKLSGSLLRNGFDVFVYDLNSQLTAKFAKKEQRLAKILHI
jgi:3-hydroxyisobutyrate dehydrogenase